ncbi:hypothetical protein BOTBODRAFT_192793 [Botryobasidium botryosum FD-172 SS1]|uniref:Steroid 5-alpha reductase C-terminal domain-containing protein n=1 Tax=Botryobasidium botryosum (strain FD-172 SS1) TaxID=930990 RepID=A0A067M5L9_BOTB1|nr:hypothetical protein BOTBODRAFT_192793 [Botryobasidium botryosum FD-172 SS1]
MATHVLDPYYLAITLLVTVGYQLSGFAIAWTFKFDKVTDFTGGSNFFVLSLLTLLLGNTFHTRNIVASVLVMVWGARIAGFLLFRVLKTGKDSRFDEIRSHFFKFLGFWIAQILWVWIVSLPVTILNSPKVSDTLRGGNNPAFGTGRDIAGIVLWGVGWLTETIADAQKYRFKASKPPKDQPTNVGLWAWCRHPPYFGEILCWWGIWTLCLSPSTNGHITSGARSAQYAAILSPLFTSFILLFGSGIPTAAKPQAKKFFLLTHSPQAKEEHALAWSNYKGYLDRTSVLIPLPPPLYKPLPGAIKHTILLDFPMYRFDEEKDGAEALEEERSRMADSASR